MTLETSEWDGPFKSKPVQYDGGKPLARRAWRHTWELCTMAVSTAGWYIWWVRSHLGVHPAGTRACLQLPAPNHLSFITIWSKPSLPPLSPYLFLKYKYKYKYTYKHKQSYLFSWPVKWKFPPKFWLASCLITDFKYCVSVEEFNSILERQTVWRRWKIRNVHWKLKCLRLAGF